MVASYNPSEHEAPVVIGHPKMNAPAYGWVQTLKREGEFLLARFKQLVPEFLDMIKRGLFKKRSIAVYPDGTLRHVGFLGAMPPAVKGLRDVDFGNFELEGEITMYEFNESNEMSAGERLHEKVLEFLEIPRDKEMAYREAFFVVCEQNPDLVKEYMEEMGRVEVKTIGSGEAGRELERKALDFIEAPNKVDQFGRKIAGKITYSEAYKIVCDRNPDLVKKLVEERRRDGIY
jgi:hypothetical protein